MRVRLIHWQPDEAAERLKQLKKAGFEVVFEPLDGSNYRTIRRDVPDAFLIDLTRLPSHGREVALALREWKDTRRVPIVFLDGEEAKIEKLRATLPDAAFATWKGVTSAVKKAIREAPAEPILPAARPGGYSGTPLPKKLGIKADTRVRLIDPPDGFEKTLGELPAGVKVSSDGRGVADLTIWFVRKRDDLRRFSATEAKLGESGLWVAWPKKASGIKTDFTENEVREGGLAVGLVDFKVCAIDETWSGLRFARRKAQKL